ncbi:MAG: hypothetical protein NT010_16620 [Proteobacteria bacterium]|nr:hypothetical protein [Pseudomonadota bacterium]
MTMEKMTTQSPLKFMWRLVATQAAVSALLVAVMTSLLLCFQPVYADNPSAPPQPSRDKIVEWLRELRPLPKVHYSWPLPTELLSNSTDDLLKEFARLTHAISLRAESADPGEIAAAVRVCKSINDTKPSIPCTVAINYSPWHRRFGKDLPPTDFGASHEAEVKLFQSRLQFVKDALKQANSLHRGNVTLSAILLDSERFHVRQNDAQWNAAITQKHRIIYDIAKSIFPSARVEQYERGGWMPSSSSTGWMQAQWYTLEEPGDAFSLSLYRIIELADTREAFRRTVNSAAIHGVSEVTPWIALGSGMRRQTDSFHRWSDGDWDYDLVYSWQIGAEINNKWFGDRPERFAPWHAAKVVIFFPAPFYQKFPSWPKHFVAYVRGANGLTTLPK